MIISWLENLNFYMDEARNGMDGSRFIDLSCRIESVGIKPFNTIIYEEIAFGPWPVFDHHDSIADLLRFGGGPE